MDEDFVSVRMCELHREVLDAKMGATTTTITALNQRIEGILEEIKEVRNLQKTIQWMLLFIAIGTACTLLGVVLGRGFDFGWIVP